MYTLYVYYMWLYSPLYIRSLGLYMYMYTYAHVPPMKVLSYDRPKV